MITLHQISMYLFSSLKRYVWSLQRYIFSTSVLMFLSTSILGGIEILARGILEDSMNYLASLLTTKKYNQSYN